MTGTPCPKPTPRQKKAKRPMQRKTRLQTRKPFRSKSSAGGETHIVAKEPWSRGGERDGAAAMPISGRRTTPPKRGPNRVSARVKAEVVTGGERPAFPKPEKKPKRRRWGVSQGPSKTAYGRRERGLGRMAFVRSLPCGVPAAFRWVGGLHLDPPGPCDGGVQCMHLGWKADPGGRRKPGDTDTAPGCELHHAESGTKLGGLGKWYVALGREGQRALRAELVAQATAAWDALSDSERRRWNEMAAARRKG